MEKDDNGNMNMGMMRGGAPITGVLGTVLGGGAMLIALAAGGMGLFGGGRGERGQNIQDRLAATEAAVAVNSQRDYDLAENTKLQIENAKQAAEIEVLKAKADLKDMFNAKFEALSNQVLTNAGILGCVVGKVNDLTQIGIPSANIITPPTGTATTSTAGA